MTIGKKISLDCVALVALTIILGTVSILNVGRINTAVNTILMDSLPGTASIGRLDGLMKEQRAFALMHMLSAMADALSEFEAELRVYEKAITTSRDRELFGRIALPLDQVSRR